MSFNLSPLQLLNKIRQALSTSLVAGSNVTITDNEGILTIASTGGGGGGGDTANAFATASVSGQSDILADSTAGTINFAAGSGISLTTNAETDTLTISATGGGGTTFNMWMADAPPDSANSKDDEFDGDLSTWNYWNPAGVATSSYIESDRLIIKRTTSGQSYSGLYQVAPTQLGGVDYEYSFWTRVSWGNKEANYPAVGLIIAQDIAANPSTSPFKSFVLVDIGDMRLEVLNWNRYNSYSGTPYQKAVYQQSVYLRIRVTYSNSSNLTTMYFDHSSDGIGWEYLGSLNESGHYLYFGVAIDNNNSSSPQQIGYWDFFRATNSSDFYQIMSGSRVQFTKA